MSIESSLNIRVSVNLAFHMSQISKLIEWVTYMFFNVCCLCFVVYVVF